MESAAIHAIAAKNTLLLITTPPRSAWLSGESSRLSPCTYPSNINTNRKLRYLTFRWMRQPIRKPNSPKPE